MKNDKKNNYVNELIKKVNDIEKELNRIFDIACDESEISVYKSSLLTAKLDALQLLLKETTDKLTNERQRTAKSYLIRHSLVVLLAVVAVFAMNVSEIIGIILWLISLTGSFIMRKVFEKTLQNSDRILEVVKNTKEFDVVFENCYRLLKGHTNSELETTLEEVNNQELRCIDLANEHIEIAMISGVVDNIPEDVRNTMIMMLQDDLQTDERDLIKLLEMANKKIEAESLTQKDEMTLSRCKNSDFVEN